MADFRRFFVKNVSAEFFIEGEEFYHAVNVLRIKEGENVIVLDNSGEEYFSVVKKINKKNLLVEVLSHSPSQNEAKHDVLLIAGYLKGDKTELVVQKAVELGVKEIVVFSSEFSSAYMNENKLLRLNKVSQESAKQCGRAIAPKVLYAENFKKALDCAKEYKHKIFACEFAKENKVDFSALSGNVALVVGSEGGFSEKESQLAENEGFSTCHLGKRILRADTASILLTGLIMHHLGELD